MVASQLIFKAGSGSFVYMHKKNDQTVGFDHLDDALDPSKTLDQQPTSELRSFAVEVKEHCAKA